jgi:hypothetical protein
MRYAVLILGILGGLICGGIGFMWMTQQMDAEQKRIHESNKQVASILPAAKAEVDLFEGRGRSYPFLLLAAVGSIAGGVLAFMRKGVIAGAVMIVVAIIPGVLYPLTFILTTLTIIGGGLAFLVKPPAPAPLPEPAPLRKAAARV